MLGVHKTSNLLAWNQLLLILLNWQVRACIFTIPIYVLSMTPAAGVIVQPGIAENHRGGRGGGGGGGGGLYTPQVIMN